MNLKTRISRLEEAAETKNNSRQHALPDECICFPEDEPPKFQWLVEAEIAATVTCPLHGHRFTRVADIDYVYRPR